MGLARQAHPQARLVEITGYPSIDGRLPAKEGSYWFYLYMDADGVLYQWRVYADGRVEDGGVNPSRAHLWPYRDIAPGLRVDTDEIATIGLANGGREFAATYPGTVMTAVVNPPLGGPNWVIQFEDLAAGPASTGCFVGLEVDPGTGAVLKTWRSSAANCTMARN
jgi:hypothetical protein